MPRQDQNLIKKTIRLYAGDTEELDGFYPTLGYNAVIRELVRRHLKRLRERTNRRLATIQKEDVPSGLIDLEEKNGNPT